MTILSFTKKVVGSMTFYEAAAQVGADFNLHLERKGQGHLTVEISTVQNAKYVTVVDEDANDTFDRDYDAIVYPKFLRVRSWSEPTAGYITEAE